MTQWQLRDYEIADGHQAYYDTPARAALDPDPAQWIVADRQRMLEPVSAGDSGPARLGL